MSLAAFYQVFRANWEALTQYLWPESPRQRAEGNLTRLAGDLGRRYQRLLQRRRRIEHLHARLIEQERRADELSVPAAEPGGQATASAWQAALVLGRLRLTAERTREVLREHEYAYQRQRQHFLRRKNRHAELRALLLQGAFSDRPVECEL